MERKEEESAGGPRFKTGLEEQTAKTDIAKRRSQDGMDHERTMSWSMGQAEVAAVSKMAAAEEE